MYYKYETHLHTFPVSACAKSSVEEVLQFYSQRKYAGIFLTNHFLDGNINIDRSKGYEEKINLYFSDYEKAVNLSSDYNIDVFLGVETSYKGTDFLIYGLDKSWFLAHPEIMDMKKSEQLNFFKANGALVIQAHPFRQAFYIDHVRLFPNCVHGMEVLNACRKKVENKMALIYAKNYNLLKFAGSDCHNVHTQEKLSGVKTKRRIINEKHFVSTILKGNYKLFTSST